ncbi:hypothetical protein [Streptomyces sp. NPDC049906]|uniref:hypothetical protein n=1 Tax=Streptomyces sp. NPDC049906 TaxID=3155656 RepID=UPI0034450798
MILDQLCPAAWGTTATPSGKVVWAEVARGGGRPAPLPSVAEILAVEFGVRPARSDSVERARDAGERLRKAVWGAGLALHGLSVVADDHRPPVIELGWCNVHTAGVLARALTAWGERPAATNGGS